MTTRLRFIDTSLRDGQQSNWATRLTHEMVLPEIERLDTMGFDWIDLVGGAVFDVCVRYLHEDPWERMRLAAAHAPHTPLNVWTRGQSLYTFELFADDIVALNARRLAANGIRRLTVYDALNDIRNIGVSVRAAREEGMTVSGQLVYTVSPFHTDEYYARVAREIVDLQVDTVGIKDPSGLLTPERARTLVPAIRAVIGDLPLEMHTHCRSGLGEAVVLESVPRGVTIVHTGIPPLGGGDALPDARYCVHQLRAAGYEIDVREADLAEMERRFTALARAHDKPIPALNRYDPFLYHHQVPGGMISNLRSQLRDIGMEDRLEEVLEEAGRVREDLGCPILVSPFAQFVITQSTINVVQGERYATIPDEVARYTLGYYGRPAAPISDEVMDRVASRTGHREQIRERPGELIEPQVEKLRRERGPFASDDDLSLAAFYKPAQLEPVMAARRTRAGGRDGEGGMKALMRTLERLPRSGHTHVHVAGVDLEAQR